MNDPRCLPRADGLRACGAGREGRRPCSARIATYSHGQMKCEREHTNSATSLHPRLQNSYKVCKCGFPNTWTSTSRLVTSPKRILRFSVFCFNFEAGFSFVSDCTVESFVTVNTGARAASVHAERSSDEMTNLRSSYIRRIHSPKTVDCAVVCCGSYVGYSETIPENTCADEGLFIKRKTPRTRENFLFAPRLGDKKCVIFRDVTNAAGTRAIKRFQGVRPLNAQTARARQPLARVLCMYCAARAPVPNCHKAFDCTYAPHGEGIRCPACAR